MIPARMAATRLPNKPLADIGGRPMIVRAYEQAAASGLPVVVAAGGCRLVDPSDRVRCRRYRLGRERVAVEHVALDGHGAGPFR